MKIYDEKKVKKVKNKFFNTNLLLKQLIKSKNQYGGLYKNFKTTNFPYIYGFKLNRAFLNIEQTSFVLKTIYKLIKTFYLKNVTKKILVVCSNYQKKKLIKTLFIGNNLNNQLIIKSNWQKGFIINNKKNIGLIILFSSPDFQIIRNEAKKQSIPIITFLNTNNLLNITNKIEYPVFYNNTNIESIYFIFSLLLNMLKKNYDFNQK